MPSHKHDYISAPRLFEEQDQTSNQIISPADGSANMMTYPTAYTGGNQPHNNMPPYYITNIWKRVA